MVESDVLIGVVRFFPNFSAALAEIVDDRGVLAAFTSARRVMTDRQRLLQFAENMSCGLRSGKRIGMRETTMIDAGQGQNSVG